MSFFAGHGEGSDDGGESFTFEILTDKEKFDLGTLPVVWSGCKLLVVHAIVDDVNSLLGILVILSNERLRELGVGDDYPGVLRIHDRALYFENGAIPGIDRFDKITNLSGIPQAHPVTLKWIGDAEGVRREVAGESDDLVDLQVLQSCLSVAIKGKVFG